MAGVHDTPLTGRLVGGRENAWADLLTWRQDIVTCEARTAEPRHQFAKQTAKPSQVSSMFRALRGAAFIVLLVIRSPGSQGLDTTWLEKFPSSDSQAL